MSSTESPRISSRLARKRTFKDENISSRNSDFEFTPVVRKTHKSSTEKKLSKSAEKTVHAEQKPALKTPPIRSDKKSNGKVQQDPPSGENGPDSTTKKRRGRPKKIIPKIKLEAEEQQQKDESSSSRENLLNNLTRDQEELLTGPDKLKSTVKLTKTDEPAGTNQLIRELSDGMSKIASGSGRDLVAENHQVFPVVAGLLNPELLSIIPGMVVETLDMVTMETGTRWEDSGQSQAKLIYGTLTSMIDASNILSNLIENTAAQATVQDPSTTVPTESAVAGEGGGEVPGVDAEVPETGPVALGEGPGGALTDSQPGDMDTQAADITAVTEQRGQADTPAPKCYKRQTTCMHKLTKCDTCQSYCDMCQFRSNELGLRKHKKRVHPSVVVPCEICAMEFGIRYDMRRHRMGHFDADGVLTTEGRRLYWARRNPPADGVTMETVPTLADLEVNFKRQDSSKTVPPTTTTTAAPSPSSNPPSPPPDTKPPLLPPAPPDVRCGFCLTTCPLDEIEAHHRVRHTSLCAENVTFVCRRCHAEFDLPEELQEHLKGECREKEQGAPEPDALLMKCRLCNETGPQDAMETHVTTHPPLYKCASCDVFESPRLLSVRHHMRLKHGVKVAPRGGERAVKKVSYPPRETSVLYKCGICEKILTTRSSLQNHFKLHEEKPLLKCVSCDFHTSSQGKMKAHLRHRHSAPSDRPRCEVCDKTFSLPSSLAFHRESVHGVGQTPRACHLCDKVFTTKRFLQTHVKRSHAKVKNFFCGTCGKGFYERTPMLAHEQVHLPETEKTKKHVCSFCGKRFHHKTILRQHENIHLGNRPYSCKLCHKSFCYNSQLSKHMAAHNNHRPHTCTFCGKSFKFRCKLTAHMVTHTKESRFACDLCGKVYTARATLRKHACKARIMDDVMVRKRHSELVAANFPASESLDRLRAEMKAEHDDVMTPLVVKDEDADVFDMIGAVVDSDVAAATVEGLPASGVLYMCSICNSLFTDQQEVNSHMRAEHGAEAVIGQDDDEQLTNQVLATVDAATVLAGDVGEAEFLVQDLDVGTISGVVADEGQVILEGDENITCV